MHKSTFLKLSVLMFLQYFLWSCWYVTAGTYLMNTLQFSGRQVGLIYGSTAIAAMVSPFFVGFLTDRYFTIEKVLGSLQLMGALLLFFLSIAKSFVLFYSLIIMYMLIFIPAFSLTNAICLHHIKDASKDFPKLRVWGTIGWIVAGLCVSLFQLEDKSTTLLIASAISFLLFIYCFLLPKTEQSSNRDLSVKEMLWGDDIKEVLKSSEFKILIICLALICIPAAYYYSFVNPFLNQMGVSNAAGKMAVGQATEIVAILSLPLIFRFVKFKWIIAVGLFLWGFRYLIFSLGAHLSSEVLYLLAIALHGPSYVFSMLSAQILIDVRISNRLRATAQGFFSFITLGMGALIGSYLAGETVNTMTGMDGSPDWTKVWIIPGLLGLLVCCFFVIFYKSMKRV